MKNPKAETMTKIADTSSALADKYFALAKPAIDMRNNSIFNALGLTPGNVMGLGARAGEPAYVSNAFAGQRTGIADQLALNNRLEATRRAPGSTNAGGLDYGSIGAKIAQAATASSVNQAMSKIEQTSNLLNMGLTGAGSVGSAAMAAGRNDLAAASMLPTISPTGQAVGLGLSTAATLYGALDKAGVFNPTSTPGTTGMNLGLQPSSMAPFGLNPSSSFFSPITSLTTAPNSFGFGNKPFGG